MLSAARRFLATTRNMVKMDSAVAKLLQLDPATTSVSSHGGGGMSSAKTAKISTRLPDGSKKLYFLKTGKGKDAEIMFHGTPPSSCKSFLHNRNDPSAYQDAYKANMHHSMPSTTPCPHSALLLLATATSQTTLASPFS